MATKTIVRYLPPHDLVGQRELLPGDLKTVGIFTQNTPLVWSRSNGFWLDAEEAGISRDLLNRLENDEAFSNPAIGHFRIERQEVPGEEAQDAEAEAVTEFEEGFVPEKEGE